VEQGQQSGGSEANGPGSPGLGAAGRLGRAAGEKLRRSWSNPAYRFVVLFLVYLAALAGVYPLLKQRFLFVFKAMILGTAKIEYWIFSLFSSDVTLSDRLVSFGGFPIKIIEECTGIYEILIFSAAVLAFPTSWRKRVLGFVLGIPTIYFFNVVRIALLIVVGRYHRESFDFMHLYFWQVSMIAMITSVWLLWIVKVVRDDEAALAASS
jgi:archaeosortase B (VPXXXP-CTERM-specific)